MSKNIRVENLADGRSILFSYNTPVAGFVPGRGYVKTDSYYSKTTSGHVNKFCGGKQHGTTLPAADFLQLLKGDI